MRKHFGGRVTRKLEQQYAHSVNWDGKRFINPEETTMEVNFRTMPGLLRKQICEREGREPRQKLPLLPFNKETFLAPAAKSKFIWYGHSVILMRISNKTLLFDPMFGPDASPIAPFATKRFSENTLDIIDSIPPIDILLLTHDHYDHLDYESIQKLIPKVNQYYVALGTARHLINWGVDATRINEFDWWDEKSFEDIKVTFTPARHFSGRGFTDRARSLWGGWVIKTGIENIYYSGDGGYGKHFKEIGEKSGPFDFAFMECGQYNELWHQIHMYPEESVQAAIDVNAGCIMPMHWGGFALSLHPWKEPVLRFVAEAKSKNINWATPKLGECYSLNDIQENTEWWQNFD